MAFMRVTAEIVVTHTHTRTQNIYVEHKVMYVYVIHMAMYAHMWASHCFASS